MHPPGLRGSFFKYGLDILSRRALPSGRLIGLGARRGFHQGLIVSGLEWLPIAAGVALALLAIPLLFFWVKGRPFSTGEVFRASRWSRGNRLFPTQVLISPTSVVHYTPEIVGRKEQSIHMAHIASVSIDTNLLFSDVVIESSGGTEPVRCHGHRKKDAIRMKALIEEYQTAYYKRPPDAAPTTTT